MLYTSERIYVPVQRTAKPRQTCSPTQLVPVDRLQASEMQRYVRQSLCGVLGKLDARPWQSVGIAEDGSHRDRICEPDP